MTLSGHGPELALVEPQSQRPHPLWAWNNCGVVVLLSQDDNPVGTETFSPHWGKKVWALCPDEVKLSPLSDTQG